MSKVLELAIENLARQLEEIKSDNKLLRHEINLLKGKTASQTKPNRQINPSTTQEASSEQLKFAKDLGMIDNTNEKITKAECAVLIKEGLVKKNKVKNDNKVPDNKDKDTPKQEDNDEKTTVGDNNIPDHFNEEGTYL